MNDITARTPWAPFLGDLPLTLEYFQGSMYEMVRDTALKMPDSVAFDFMGRRTTYGRMIEKIDLIALSLSHEGVGENDRVTIAMPNCPQAIYILYAVNKLGAVANMVHPLSAEKEIEFSHD